MDGYCDQHLHVHTSNIWNRRGFALKMPIGLEGNRLSVGSICTSSSRNLRLPLVTVGEELLLVVQKLLTGLSGILGVGS